MKLVVSDHSRTMVVWLLLVLLGSVLQTAQAYVECTSAGSTYTYADLVDAECDYVDGDFELDCDDETTVTDVELPHIHTINGDLAIQNCEKATSINFAGLNFVNGDIMLQANVIGVLNLSNLTSVASDVLFNDNTIEEVVLDNLSDEQLVLNGEFSVERNKFTGGPAFSLDNVLLENNVYFMYNHGASFSVDFAHVTLSNDVAFYFTYNEDGLSVNFKYLEPEEYNGNLYLTRNHAVTATFLESDFGAGSVAHIKYSDGNVELDASGLKVDSLSLKYIDGNFDFVGTHLYTHDFELRHVEESVDVELKHVTMEDFLIEYQSGSSHVINVAINYHTGTFTSDPCCQYFYVEDNEGEIIFAVDKSTSTHYLEFNYNHRGLTLDLSHVYNVEDLSVGHQGYNVGGSSISIALSHVGQSSESDDTDPEFTFKYSFAEETITLDFSYSFLAIEATLDAGKYFTHREGDGPTYFQMATDFILNYNAAQDQMDLSFTFSMLYETHVKYNHSGSASVTFDTVFAFDYLAIQHNIGINTIRASFSRGAAECYFEHNHSSLGALTIDWDHVFWLESSSDYLKVNHNTGLRSIYIVDSLMNGYIHFKHNHGENLDFKIQRSMKGDNGDFLVENNFFSNQSITFADFIFYDSPPSLDLEFEHNHGNVDLVLHLLVGTENLGIEFEYSFLGNPTMTVTSSWIGYLEVNHHDSGTDEANFQFEAVFTTHDFLETHSVHGAGELTATMVASSTWLDVTRLSSEDYNRVERNFLREKATFEFSAIPEDLYFSNNSFSEEVKVDTCYFGDGDSIDTHVQKALGFHNAQAVFQYLGSHADYPSLNNEATKKVHFNNNFSPYYVSGFVVQKYSHINDLYMTRLLMPVFNVGTQMEGHVIIDEHITFSSDRTGTVSFNGGKLNLDSRVPYKESSYAGLIQANLSGEITKVSLSNGAFLNYAIFQDISGLELRDGENPFLVENNLLVSPNVAADDGNCLNECYSEIPGIRLHSLDGNFDLALNNNLSLLALEYDRNIGATIKLINNLAQEVSLANNGLSQIQLLAFTRDDEQSSMKSFTMEDTLLSLVFLKSVYGFEESQGLDIDDSKLQALVLSYSDAGAVDLLNVHVSHPLESHLYIGNEGSFVYNDAFSVEGDKYENVILNYIQPGSIPVDITFSQVFLETFFTHDLFRGVQEISISHVEPLGQVEVSEFIGGRFFVLHNNLDGNSVTVDTAVLRERFSVDNNQGAEQVSLDNVHLYSSLAVRYNEGMAVGVSVQDLNALMNTSHGNNNHDDGFQLKNNVGSGTLAKFDIDDMFMHMLMWTELGARVGVPTTEGVFENPLLLKYNQGVAYVEMTNGVVSLSNLGLSHLAGSKGTNIAVKELTLFETGVNLNTEETSFVEIKYNTLKASLSLEGIVMASLGYVKYGASISHNDSWNTSDMAEAYITSSYWSSTFFYAPLTDDTHFTSLVSANVGNNLEGLTVKHSTLGSFEYSGLKSSYAERALAVHNSIVKGLLEIDANSYTLNVSVDSTRLGRLFVQDFGNGVSEYIRVENVDVVGDFVHELRTLDENGMIVLGDLDVSELQLSEVVISVPYGNYNGLDGSDGSDDNTVKYLSSFTVTDVKVLADVYLKYGMYIYGLYSSHGESLDLELAHLEFPGWNRMYGYGSGAMTSSVRYLRTTHFAMSTHRQWSWSAKYDGSTTIDATSWTAQYTEFMDACIAGPFAPTRPSTFTMSHINAYWVDFNGLKYVDDVRFTYINAYDLDFYWEGAASRLPKYYLDLLIAHVSTVDLEVRPGDNSDVILTNVWARYFLDLEVGYLDLTGIDDAMCYVWKYSDNGWGDWSAPDTYDNGLDDCDVSTVNVCKNFAKYVDNWVAVDGGKYDLDDCDIFVDSTPGGLTITDMDRDLELTRLKFVFTESYEPQDVDVKSSADEIDIALGFFWAGDVVIQDNQINDITIGGTDYMSNLYSLYIGGDEASDGNLVSGSITVANVVVLNGDLGIRHNEVLDGVGAFSIDVAHVFSHVKYELTVSHNDNVSSVNISHINALDWLETHGDEGAQIVLAYNHLPGELTVQYVASLRRMTINGNSHLTHVSIHNVYQKPNMAQDNDPINGQLYLSENTDGVDTSFSLTNNRLMYVIIEDNTGLNDMTLANSYMGKLKVDNNDSSDDGFSLSLSHSTMWGAITVVNDLDTQKAFTIQDNHLTAISITHLTCEKGLNLQYNRGTDIVVTLSHVELYTTNHEYVDDVPQQEDSLRIRHNTDLKSVTFDNLKLQGLLDISHNDSETGWTIDLANSHVGDGNFGNWSPQNDDIKITHNHELYSIDVEALTARVKYISIQHNDAPALLGLQFTLANSNLMGAQYVGARSLDENPSTQLEFGAKFSFDTNTKLKSMDITHSYLGNFNIEDNEGNQQETLFRIKYVELLSVFPQFEYDIDYDFYRSTISNNQDVALVHIEHLRRALAPDPVHDDPDQKNHVDVFDISGNDGTKGSIEIKSMAYTTGVMTVSENVFDELKLTFSDILSMEGAIHVWENNCDTLDIAISNLVSRTEYRAQAEDLAPSDFWIFNGVRSSNSFWENDGLKYLTVAYTHSTTGFAIVNNDPVSSATGSFVDFTHVYLKLYSQIYIHGNSDLMSLKIQESQLGSVFIHENEMIQLGGDIKLVHNRQHSGLYIGYNYDLNELHVRYHEFTQDVFSFGPFDKAGDTLDYSETWGEIGITATTFDSSAEPLSETLMSKTITIKYNRGFDTMDLEISLDNIDMFLTHYRSNKISNNDEVASIRLQHITQAEVSSSTEKPVFPSNKFRVERNEVGSIEVVDTIANQFFFRYNHELINVEISHFQNTHHIEISHNEAANEMTLDVHDGTFWGRGYHFSTREQLLGIRYNYDLRHVNVENVIGALKVDLKSNEGPRDIGLDVTLSHVGASHELYVFAPMSWYINSSDNTSANYVELLENHELASVSISYADTPYIRIKYHEFNTAVLADWTIDVKGWTNPRFASTGMLRFGYFQGFVEEGADAHFNSNVVEIKYNEGVKSIIFHEPIQTSGTVVINYNEDTKYINLRGFNLPDPAEFPGKDLDSCRVTAFVLPPFYKFTQDDLHLVRCAGVRIVDLDEDRDPEDDKYMTQHKYIHTRSALLLNVELNLLEPETSDVTYRWFLANVKNNDVEASDDDSEFPWEVTSNCQGGGLNEECRLRTWFGGDAGPLNLAWTARDQKFLPELAILHLYSENLNVQKVSINPHGQRAFGVIAGWKTGYVDIGVNVVEKVPDGRSQNFFDFYRVFVNPEPACDDPAPSPSDGTALLTPFTIITDSDCDEYQRTFYRERAADGSLAYLGSIDAGESDNFEIASLARGDWVDDVGDRVIAKLIVVVEDVDYETAKENNGMLEQTIEITVTASEEFNTIGLETIYKENYVPDETRANALLVLGSVLAHIDELLEYLEDDKDSVSLETQYNATTLFADYLNEIEVDIEVMELIVAVERMSDCSTCFTGGFEIFEFIAKNLFEDHMVPELSDVSDEDAAQAISAMFYAAARLLTWITDPSQDCDALDEVNEAHLDVVEILYSAFFEALMLATTSTNLQNVDDFVRMEEHGFQFAAQRFDASEDTVVSVSDVVTVTVYAYSDTSLETLYDIHSVLTDDCFFSPALGDSLGPIVSIGLYDNDGNQAAAFDHDFVYVEFTLDEDLECVNFDCYGWNFTKSEWDKSGIFGSARSLTAPTRAQCRLNGCDGGEDTCDPVTLIVICKPGMAVVGDPFVLAPTTNEWVPFLPATDQLYSLLEGKDFRLQGGFAAATKASCQCVWVDEDETAAPRAGNRLAALIFEFNGGVFHITPTGLYYQEGGEWILVSDEQWNPASLAQIQGPVKSQISGGDYLSNDVAITWGPVHKTKAFPWGSHDYSHELKATLPGSGQLTVLAGVADGINVMDVFFDPENDEPMNGLLGAARRDGPAGIAAFASSLQPLQLPTQ